MSTIEEAKTEFVRYNLSRDSLGDVSNELFIDWSNIIDGAYWRMAIKADPGRFLTEQSIKTTNTTRSFLISDLYTLNVSGGGVFDTDGDNEITDIYTTRTNKGSSKSGYYINGKTVYFTPDKESITPNTYVIRYIPTRTILTKMSDEILIPDEYIDARLRSYNRIYEMWLKSQSINLADALLQASINDMIPNLNPDNPNSLPLNTSCY